ncbi:MAG: glycosyltransferase family 2 protein, partial [Paludibacteraceae bacterium]|nr:glycosyltransferase family 2 protein [Paludibacteraceae bacterium]
MTTCAVIPCYNNVTTAADIVRRTLVYLPTIAVVDGATDGTLESLSAIQDERLTIVSYTPNRGKGYALKQGFKKARELGYTHVLTLDSDGQHYPEDIPELMKVSAVRPEAIIVGSRGTKHDNMPQRSTFANRFSNFWFAVQTGWPLPDTQTGFRIYPLDEL